MTDQQTLDGLDPGEELRQIQREHGAARRAQREILDAARRASRELLKRNVDLVEGEGRG